MKVSKLTEKKKRIIEGKIGRKIICYSCGEEVKLGEVFITTVYRGLRRYRHLKCYNAY